jgi:hypothetical protein
MKETIARESDAWLIALAETEIAGNVGWKCMGGITFCGIENRSTTAKWNETEYNFYSFKPLVMEIC